MEKNKNTNTKQTPKIIGDPVNVISSSDIKPGLVIDEYFNNGFNKSAAIQSVYPDYNHNTARYEASRLFKRPDIKQLIEYKRNTLKELSDIRQEQILRELIQFAYSDATLYIGLTVSEIKALPTDIRRCIQSVKVTNKKYKDRQGKEVEDQTIEIKLVSKIHSIEMINKHIGFYSEDNSQKQSNINILQVLEQSDPNALNSLLQAMQTAKQTKTIDISSS